MIKGIWEWCGSVKFTISVVEGKQLMSKIEKKNQVLAAYAYYLEIWK